MQKAKSYIDPSLHLFHMPTSPVYCNPHFISMFTLVIQLPCLSTVATATQIKCKKLEYDCNVVIGVEGIL